MEATAEGLGLLKGGIHPPRLEDAGLEDCALSPEAIKEAFSRAAKSIKSRVTTDDDKEEESACCIEDPGPSNGEVPDVLLGASEIPTKPLCGGMCEKGSFPTGEEQGRGDDVVVVVVGAGEWEGEPSSDKVVVLGGEDELKSEVGRKRACVDDGVQRGDGEKKDHLDGDNDDEKPLLAEALI